MPTPGTKLAPERPTFDEAFPGLIDSLKAGMADKENPLLPDEVRVTLEQASRVYEGQFGTPEIGGFDKPVGPRGFTVDKTMQQIGITEEPSSAVALAGAVGGIAGFAAGGIPGGALFSFLAGLTTKQIEETLAELRGGDSKDLPEALATIVGAGALEAIYDVTGATAAKVVGKAARPLAKKFGPAGRRAQKILGEQTLEFRKFLSGKLGSVLPDGFRLKPGVKLNIAQATESRPFDILFNILHASPIGGSILEKEFLAQEEAFFNIMRRHARSVVGDVSPEELGRLINAGLKGVSESLKGGVKLTRLQITHRKGIEAAIQEWVKLEPAKVAKLVFQPGSKVKISALHAFLPKKDIAKLQGHFMTTAMEKGFTVEGVAQGRFEARGIKGFLNKYSKEDINAYFPKTRKTALGAKEKPFGRQAYENFLDGVDGLLLAQTRGSKNLGTMLIQLAQGGAIVEIATGAVSGIGRAVGVPLGEGKFTGTSAVIIFGPGVLARILTNRVATRWLTEGLTIPLASPRSGALGAKLVNWYLRDRYGKEKLERGRARRSILADQPELLAPAEFYPELAAIGEQARQGLEVHLPAN